LPELHKHLTRNFFSEDICLHLLGGNILKCDFTTFHTLANKMVLDINVLCMRMIDQIMSKGSMPLIIHMDNSHRNLKII